MGELSPWHLLIVAGVFVLLFGSKKLPDAARSLGKSMRIMKTEIKGLHEDEKPAAPAELAASQPANADAPTAEQTSSTS
ncbi:MAG TPA: Sec-independent protein translocase subunit TatA [Mycobacteriales bacterium]|nr:Sec-independent protein translocase subunit TatA [Mycobacteriales bacterium]